MKIKAGGKFAIILLVAGIVGAGIWKSGALDEAQNKVASVANTTIASVALPKGGQKVSELGTKTNPLKVSIVSFHGYAPGLLANGGMKTQVGSINDRNGLEVEFLLQDDIPTLSTLYGSGVAQCAWRTSDFWAQEHPNLRNAKGDGKAVMIVDNTQGGDAIIARDPAIRTVEDLAGRSIALLQFTPSHGFLIKTIENSSMTPRKKQEITKKLKFINADEGTGGVRAAYESGNVDAAVIWDPDLALALRSGGHVVYSTKQASNLIFDVMVCDTQVLNDPAGADVIQKFVNGWMDGVKEARNNPDLAVQVLVKSEPMFEQLKQKEGAAFIKSLFGNVKWTGLEDNVRILGMGSESNHYERVYKEFDQIYRAEGALANPMSPVINPADSFDYRFIKKLVAENPNVVQIADQQAPKYTTSELAKAVSQGAAVTKPVMVTFNSGSAELTQRTKKQIDSEMVPFIENNGSSYIEISGNTDSVGSNATNIPLSKARANAVAQYLIDQWGFPKAKFSVVGNGSSRPICNESTLEMPINECREMNRSTRVAVLGR